ncbi:endonuclease/exonuclease/phosphatase family protein [Pseudarthrobacter sp. W1I19]|uniref:endonuclease/exonuclease/phosphatase family protein n=1 Tax=Pseudarthrobacter sp. W1I19 TaxID=3042288 RepID=UPI0027D7F004|nr:endonuclease/exonuclease/phosphatase family protein [Pseudarthrobacter sp. W1I19]
MQKNGAGLRQGPRPRRVSWWSVSAAVLAAPGAVLLALRLVPWDIGTPWIQLLSFFPAALITTAAGLAAAVVALCIRPGAARSLVAALAAGVLVAQFSLVLGRIVPAAGEDNLQSAALPAGQPAAKALPRKQTLTVMAVNVGSRGIDAAALLAEVKSRNVDVLALPELAPQGLEELDIAGLATVLPGRAPDVDWAGTGNALFARFPLEQAERVPGSVFYQSQAVAVVPGVAAPVHLTAVHIDSPLPGHTRTWRAELRQLGELWRAAPEGEPTILLGDFNATADHREFRDLLALGLTDAARTAGKGLVPTWPVNSPVPAFAALDHVLVSPGIGIAEVEVVTLPGTDHAAVVARLVLQQKQALP